MNRMVKLWVLVLIVILVGCSSFVAGLRMVDFDQIIEAINAPFTGDVPEVIQGKLAGAAVAATGNQTLSDAWEELCGEVVDICTEQEERGRQPKH